ncbi:class I SAM-dependent methyltransferase [Nocardia xishanensis]|uniref:class I SAM-dependent methyltransferase n=1 Tax=Nocardia xishanensis TaxID=238964 RepID=UPI00343F40E8
MDWVREFYSRSGSWWGRAEARVTDRDRRRVNLLREHGVPDGRILELGSGYGTTAVATAQAGFEVTAVEVSDRADFTSGLARDVTPGILTVHKADFYAIELDGPFDAVCYWNGFGVGSDADQRRLLDRIASRWLRPGGVALVDVFHPFVWASWAGDEEHRLPNPTAGYDYELRERIQFDPVTCTAIDTWWEPATADRAITQSLRCYTPADLMLLLGGTGLTLTAIVVGEKTSTVTSHPGLVGLLREEFEYLAILHRTTDGGP